jgi:hypothetical protein
MFFYVVIEAIVGVVLGIILATRTKKVDGVVYGKLDRIGRITNILLAIVYAIASPFYLFLGLISEPDGEGVLIILGVIVSVIAASASLFCSLGLGFSVALRKKGKSGLSFAAQFAGIAGIALMVLLYMAFVGSLISPLN